MNIHESQEDYLEAILMLREERGYARSVDIAAKLSVTKPSVSYAMKRLREDGFITMDSDNLIDLTDKGMEIASRVYDRHTTLTKGLIMLGVEPDIARKDACRIEHDLTEQTFQLIKQYVNSRQ